MPPDRDWKVRIDDMLEAIEKIRAYTKGMTQGTFSADTKTVDAVVRNFEVLGEAARNIPPEIEKQNPGIPWSKIRGMRHLLAHEYFGVNHEILWKTAAENLPPLVPLLKALLR